MRGLPREGLHTTIKTAKDYPAPDTAAVVILVKIANERHVIRQIDVSCIGTSTKARQLRVEIPTGTLAWKTLIPKTGAGDGKPLHFPFHQGLYDKDNLNQTMRIAVTDFDSADNLTSTIAKLNVLYE